jgi:surface polysaccharide O-acyltransferase-like enzyme
LGILTALLLSNAIGISVVGALGFYHSVPVWNSFFYYAAYLLLGYLISTTECRKYKPAALAVLVISVLTAVGGNYIVNRHISQTLSGYFSNYFSIPTIFAAISIMYFFKDMRIPDRYRTFINNVSGLTLGIYVIHPLFINLLRTFSPTLDQAKYPTLLIIVTAVGAFIFATGSSWIIARIPYVRRII